MHNPLTRSPMHPYSSHSPILAALVLSQTDRSSRSTLSSSHLSYLTSLSTQASHTVLLLLLSSHFILLSIVNIEFCRERTTSQASLWFDDLNYTNLPIVGPFARPREMADEIVAPIKNILKAFELGLKLAKRSKSASGISAAQALQISESAQCLQRSIERITEAYQRCLAECGEPFGRTLQNDGMS